MSARAVKAIRHSKSSASIAGYSFVKASLLDEALSHPSLSGTYNYQRLEFLGDRVLGLVISTWLLEVYPREAEGKLNRRFTSLVRRETLADVSRQLDLPSRMKLTPGAEQEGTREKEAIQADICESVIGAIYLDGGFDAANAFIRQHWGNLLSHEFEAKKDYKSLLQEWCQARAVALPSYKIVERSGPDHDPLFTIEVAIDKHGAAQATGAAKRHAEQAAAQQLYLIVSGDSRD